MKRVLQSARVFLAETHIGPKLFVITLVAHLAVFYALLYFYGPCSFFLSNDCKLNGNDTQHYVILAENLTHENVYSRFLTPPMEPDALRTPLLPLYFVPFTYFADYHLIWLAILLLNIILSLAPVVLYKITRLYLPHGYALIAGFLMVFEPLYLYRSQIAEPDALLVLLLLTSVFFMVRSWRRNTPADFYRAAFLLGLSVLAKPAALYLMAIVFIFEIAFLVFFNFENILPRLKRLGVGFLITCAVIMPWIVRNTLVFGVPAVSSILSYNLYQYYTESIALPGEDVPFAIEIGSREPSRYLPYQRFFMGLALSRIQAHPFEYLKVQAVGSLRNLFVSDISQIYYYGHTKLLPFPYNPESRTNIHELLLSGKIFASPSVFMNLHVLPKIIWSAILFVLYSLALFGWIMSWRRDRVTFLSFTMFLCLFGYLVVSSGPFVDAKYRLPALGLIAIVSLYGLERIFTRYALPSDHTLV